MVNICTGTTDYTEEERYSSDLGQQAHDWYITEKVVIKIKNDLKYIEKLEQEKILDENIAQAALNALQQEGRTNAYQCANGVSLY